MGVFSFDSVVKFESDIQTYEVLAGKKGHPIARAVVGGAFFGPLGAVIGASTSKDTRHRKTVEGDRYVNIYYKDPSQNTGIRKETFYSADDTVIVRLKECLKRAFENRNKEEMVAVSLIEAQEEPQKENIKYSDLIELKRLLDMGIVTQEELNRKNKEILDI
ncbi:MAG: hypothetical protein HFJ04_03485 [Lachnospiraceae bacterium]|nr:hypothetical protein [Lachnospiraceae bacterium]